MRIIQTTIRKTVGSAEWIVRAYVAGPNGLPVRYPAADYFTGDREDALATSKAMLREGMEDDERYD